MIQIEHDNYKVVAVSINDVAVKFNQNSFIGDILYNLSCKYAEETIIWFHSLQKGNVNLNFIESEKHLDRLMMSYNPFGNYFPDQIGYVEDSPFIKVNKAVRYPTWQMSSVVGMMSCSIIKQTEKKMWHYKDFDFCLNTVGKNYQPLGLFCYSEPKLLSNRSEVKLSPKADFFQLFAFVRKNYRLPWSFLLFINFLVYERKLRLLALVLSFRFRKLIYLGTQISFKIKENAIDFNQEDIDVIIPTIGREKYLYDVLLDLKRQTHLPRKVIIVEQNPIISSETKLQYIKDKDWPFIIEHVFTHKTGACHARNLALTFLESKWVFFADDDILFEDFFLKHALQCLAPLEIKAATFNCLRIGESNDNICISQTTMFGAGCSIVMAGVLKQIRFDESFEFGYGEDADFGMQLRNSGVDVVYCPSPIIEHLKAPTGGFRTKVFHPWEVRGEIPKPSPSIMLYKNRHSTEKQTLGFKTTLFLKYYQKQKIKNPIKYMKLFKTQWSSSQQWSETIKKRN